MKILFLDQSGKLGGAELSLADVATTYRDRSLVGLFADGAFRELLEERKIPVKIKKIPLKNPLITIFNKELIAKS